MSRSAGLAFALAVALLASLDPSPAFAYRSLAASSSVDPSRTECTDCHGATSATDRYGPHGGYTTTSNKCKLCHSVHVGQSVMLLPKQTVKATCEVCHDGTGGDGVYGVLAARGVAVGASHRIDVTNIVPGGEPSTGGSSTVTFTGEGGSLSCDDCHSPHGAESTSRTVAPFLGDRIRATDGTPTPSTHLLVQRPTGATTSTPVYGSDWCGACHRARLVSFDETMHAGNHPTDSSVSTPSPFYVGRLAVIASDEPTDQTVIGALGRSNRGYLMLEPRSPEQTGHAPICQQCHGNARDPGSLLATGTVADVATYSVTGTGSVEASDNPRFTVFPHEAENDYFLVETGDRLCTNCHAVLK